MSQRTSIEWTDYSWNFLRGCQRVSPGCGTALAGGCYAERQAIRQAGPGGAYEGLVKSTPGGPRWTGVVRHVEKILREPLSWKTPRRVFVNSMSDLFHEGVPDELLDRAFAVMAMTPHVTYQILTKRADRMLRYFTARRARGLADEPVTETTLWYVWAAATEFEEAWRGVIPSWVVQPWAWAWLDHAAGPGGIDGPWPLPNVWLGVSVEDQQRADERIPLLLQTPAAVRWVSAEPLLGPVDLTNVWLPDGDALGRDLFSHGTGDGLAWVVVGGESGPGARSCDVAWVRSILRQCRDAGVPAFCKQLGSNVECIDVIDAADYFPGLVRLSEAPRPNARVHLNHPKGGDPAEWPEDLRVREFPTTRTGVML